MARTRAKSTYLRGIRDGLPFILVIAPLAALFGVVAAEAGLNIAEVMGFSVLIIAGASQFTALSLLQDNAPTVMVLLTALAVNMRMAMYSAALAPHLGPAPLWQRALAAYFLVDQAYALSHLEYEARPDTPVSEKLAYFAGTMSPAVPIWYGGTWAGAALGAAIPESLALDFALPITFLALFAPALKTVAHLAAATVSILVTLALAGLPYGTGLLIAALCAMLTGALTETRLTRPRGQS